MLPTPTSRALGAVRVALAMLALAALATSFDRTLYDHSGVGNYFSYFTNLSNLFGATVFLLGGIRALRGRPPLDGRLRGAAVLYLVITGLVYWELLAGTRDAETITWANDVVHTVMPVAFLLDWLFAPPVTRPERLRVTAALPWLAYPLAYLAYSLIRGPIVGWYPYAFLDPRKDGYVHVTTWSLIITGAFVLFLLLIVFAANHPVPPRRAGTMSPNAVESPRSGQPDQFSVLPSVDDASAEIGVNRTP